MGLVVADSVVVNDVRYFMLFGRDATDEGETRVSVRIDGFDEGDENGLVCSGGKECQLHLHQNETDKPIVIIRFLKYSSHCIHGSFVRLDTTSHFLSFAPNPLQAICVVACFHFPYLSSSTSFCSCLFHR